MEEFLRDALFAEVQGEEFAVAVRQRRDGRLVGSTRFLDVSSTHRGVEIGWTWYAPSAWGTTVHPECKLLLLGHAFDTWGAVRVTLKTDQMNNRSQAAIRALGARYEGTLRHHRIRRNGSLRDTVVFSILADEWPATRALLRARLGAARS
jgi:RimJ/RimL family protein N-acetyltransferase